MNKHLSGVHHDGTVNFVTNDAPRIGETITLTLNTKKSLSVERVTLRAVHDGEPVSIAAQLARSTETEDVWQAELLIRNVRQHYRWLVIGGTLKYGWLNAAGFYHRDVTDAFDFAVTAYEKTPEWMHSSVAYQIFPDRFATSGRITDVPDYLVPRTWGDAPEGRSKNTGVEYFGGDLWGIAEKLDYLQELGVNIVYMTPIFPARTTHRYDASSFDEIDPLLGGNDALIHLVKEAHKRSMKVIGDITLNHCGNSHEWFTQAQQGHPTYSKFFTFNPSLPNGYECWLGHKHLPKFDYRSNELREILITGPHSILRKWLQPPFNLDGWRVDVANMSGRQADIDLTHEIARLARVAISEEGDDKVLIAEHFHDAGADLPGDGWHGTMNYAAFLRPVLSWLVGKDFQEFADQNPIPMPRSTAFEMVDAIEEFSARMPWRSRLSSWTLLCSHDTARVRSIVGEGTRQLAALGLLIGLPGTPMIFMGDELGAEGLWGESARTTMPWDMDFASNETLTHYRALLHLRRELNVLAVGGLKWVHIQDDAVVFERKLGDESIYIAIARSATRIDLEAHFPEQVLYGSTTVDRGTLVFDSAGLLIWR
jgi:alpha-glucosidase